MSDVKQEERHAQTHHASALCRLHPTLRAVWMSTPHDLRMSVATAATARRSTTSLPSPAQKREIGRAEDQALAAVGAGRDPLVFTATGPDDPALARFASAIEASGQHAGEINDRSDLALDASWAE